LENGGGMVKMDEPKVGVFLSDCDGQITKTLNFKDLIKYAKSLPGVVYVKQNKEFSSAAGLTLIKDAIKTKDLNRIVVSADEPITSLIKISQAVQDSGLNPYLLEVLYLKEHCAVPHKNEPANATQKAKAMLLAAVEKVKLQEPIKTLEYPVRKSTLIIGGGLAGMQAAIDLTDMGFPVTLVERLPILGGMASCAGKFFPTDDCAPCVESPSCGLNGITTTSRKCIYRSGFTEIPNLTILTNTDVVGVDGVPGDYKVSVETRLRRPHQTSVYPPPFISLRQQTHAMNQIFDFKGEKESSTLDVGTIIVATGFEIYDPSNIKEYNYGVYPNIIDQLALARMLNGFGPTKGVLRKPSDGKKVNKVVMIQCVGSRDERWNTYCSGICCMIALKHAKLIKEQFPETDVNICYIDIRSGGKGHEDYYEEARELGVKFVKGRPTEVFQDPETDKLIVDVEDALLGKFLELDADLVVLSPAFVPSTGTDTLAELLGLELTDDGFFKEYNAKLRPTETKQRGIYISGANTYPKDTPTTSLHASSAALKAAKFMRTGVLTKDQKTALIDADLCGDCEFCPVTCPYDAISEKQVDDEHVIEEVNELLCEGCGSCVGTCPVNAIELRHLSDQQIVAQINSLVGDGGNDPKVLAFCCSECGGTVLDSAGMSRLQYPSNVRAIKVPCTGMLKIPHFLEAFNAGADAVMVVGCKEDGCHYEAGSEKAKIKVDFTKRLLGLYGIAPERIEMFHNVYVEGLDFVNEAKGMTEIVKKLGPLQRQIVE
jgi:heterodisulfide reductase subunit A